MRVAYSLGYLFRSANYSSFPLKALSYHGRAVQSYVPAPVLIEDLQAIHSTAYLESIRSGKGPLARTASGSWSERYRDASLSMNGGMLLAARLALNYGISANLAQGFLHARADAGADGCTFNGIALLAHKSPDKKVAVINCNNDPGVALAEYAEKLPNLHHFAICGKDARCPQHERSTMIIHDPTDPSGFHFWRGMKSVMECEPDLVIYLAGLDMDPDPERQKGLKERDSFVIQEFANEEIPCLIIPGGGGGGLTKKQIPLAKQTLDVASDILKKAIEDKTQRHFLTHHSATMVLLSDPGSESDGIWATGMTPEELEVWWLSQPSFAKPITPMDFFLHERFDFEVPDLTNPVFYGPVPGKIVYAEGALLRKFWREKATQWNEIGWYAGHLCCDSDSFLQRPDGSYVERPSK